MKIFIAIIVAVAALAMTTEAVPDKVVCYYGSWSRYRPVDGKFNTTDIKPKLCTHFIYAFVGLDAASNGVKILDVEDWEDFTNRTFVQLKSQNPDLKVLLAIGGWNVDSSDFSKVVSNPSYRAAFVNNIAVFVKQNGFDGLDFHWIYPAQRGGASSDKANFILCLKELRGKFNPDGLLLTAAVGAHVNNIDISYNVPEMIKYLDFINVMTYDLHGAYDGKTGQNAPLLASSKDTTPHEKTLNVKSCIEAWISAGASPSKLVLGLGAYGTSFTLKDPANNTLGATASAGAPGRYTSEAGFLGYNEICENIKFNGWTEVWDDEQKVPYAYKDNQWVGYDNPKSIALKVDFIKSKGLGGAMIWTIDTDDFKGKCGKKYAILNTVYSKICPNIITCILNLLFG